MPALLGVALVPQEISLSPLAMNLKRIQKMKRKSDGSGYFEGQVIKTMFPFPESLMTSSSKGRSDSTAHCSC